MRKTCGQSFRFIEPRPNKMVFLEPLGKQLMINLAQVVEVRRVNWSLEFVLRYQTKEYKTVEIPYTSPYKADAAYEKLRTSLLEGAASPNGGHCGADSPAKGPNRPTGHD